LKNKSKSVSPISSFQESQIKNQSLNKLIAVAKKNRVTTVQQAQGTCLTMSLEICQLAEEYNIPVELVMWPVKNDPAFCDHWAVRINPTQVIDLTRIQVDGKASTNVIFDIADYPTNYKAYRLYNTTSLLKEYRFFKSTYNQKLPPVLIKNIRNLMLKQDIGNVNHFKNLSGVTTAVLVYLRFRLFFYFSQLEEKLLRRRDELKNR